ncbi:hypothetical protein GFC29_3851 (plasmid) [Anoxybacillus sp. B7M1]|nr:hypothetical protein [Anoxybacillus sp. B7M1]ANB66146.1 hypothetical protein GFC29_3851 [Anoxybacillus sp. B7M1]
MIDFRKATRRQLAIIILFDDCPNDLKDRAYQELRDRLKNRKEKEL